MKPRPKRRWARRAARWIGAILGALILFTIVDGWRAFGHRAEGKRLARMQRSPQWKDGHFENPEPLINDGWITLKGAFHASDHASPAPPLAVDPVDPRRFDAPPPTGLRVTWFGHSSVLVEIDGRRLLTDPMWSDRASPLTWIGPKRWFSPPIALEDLPRLDAVVISHDHYDHLDYRSISRLKDRVDRFIVPLGVGAHLAYWGVPEDHIAELDWWEKTEIGELTVVATPARHASGRVMIDNNAKLWASYAFLGPKHRAFFSGDTGLFPAMKDIGARFGPFDVTMIETGQYHAGWPDWHIGPEQAVIAHGLLRGRVMFPIHWGALQLAYHGWTEPIERVTRAADRAHAVIVAPRPGQSVEPQDPPAVARWWPDLSWETADQSPIVSSQVPAGISADPPR